MADYWVNFDTGIDTNSGADEAHAFKTITKAMSLCTTGPDRIFVTPSVTPMPYQSCVDKPSRTAPVELIGLKRNGVRPEVQNIRFWNHKGTRIRGFKFTTGTQDYNVDFTRQNGGNLPPGCVDCILSHCEIVPGPLKVGLSINTFGSDVRVMKTWVHGSQADANCSGISGPNTTTTTTLSVDALTGSTSITVADRTGILPSMEIMISTGIGNAVDAEFIKVSSSYTATTGAGVVTLATATLKDHVAGVNIAQLRQVTRVTLFCNTLETFQQDCLQMNCWDDVLIEGCHHHDPNDPNQILHNDTCQSGGMHRRIRVRSCRFRLSASQNIFFKSDFGPIIDSVIESCEVWSGGGNLVSFIGCKGVRVINLSVTKGGINGANILAGDYLSIPSESVIFFNNVAEAVGVTGTQKVSLAANNVVQNALTLSVFETQRNNIVSPLTTSLVDPINGDLSLKAGSSAKSFGLFQHSGLNVDRWGRVRGDVLDAGCFQT